jgi:exonuclease III
MSPDIVALQEVTATTVKEFRVLFPASGFPFVEHTCHHTFPSENLERARCYGELVASRWPIETMPDGLCEMPWPERLLSVLVHSPFGEMELHVGYVPPGSSHGWLKVETFEGIFKRLACTSTHPRILCGDFNTPKGERADGRIITWAECIGRNGTISLRKTRGERWDKAERGVLAGLACHELHDVFRSLHGYAAQDFSWFITRNGKTTGRRFDHVFASLSLNAVSCRYVHSLREHDLSDHSAIEATFQPQA